jgi:SAM-dependent MidA family methyltransferase
MTELLRELREIIASEGPVSLERYIALALAHPQFGYYTTREPFGAAGDFVTAPEISQMFGELIGLWAAEVWRLSELPPPMRLVELGPGRGTLMADALRAVRGIPTLADEVEVHLVETSPRLIEIQRGTLGEYKVPIRWHSEIADIPEAAAIIIANEFFDALPVQHFVRTQKGWCERMVGLDAEGKLKFGLRPHPVGDLSGPAREGTIVEINPAARAIVRALSARIVAKGGALLIVDYGYAETQLGDTLQSLRDHRFVDPLESPGESDLTAHVDFAALAREADAAGARVHGPVHQAQFLLSLGIRERAETLQREASPRQAQSITSALARLTDFSMPTSMGRLFKALAITPRDMHSIPGFAN